MCRTPHWRGKWEAGREWFWKSHSYLCRLQNPHLRSARIMRSVWPSGTLWNSYILGSFVFCFDEEHCVGMQGAESLMTRGTFTRHGGGGASQLVTSVALWWVGSAGPKFCPCFAARPLPAGSSVLGADPLWVSRGGGRVCLHSIVLYSEGVNCLLSSVSRKVFLSG